MIALPQVIDKLYHIEFIECTSQRVEIHNDSGNGQRNTTVPMTSGRVQWKTYWISQYLRILQLICIEYNIIFPQIGKVCMNPISDTEPTLLLTPEVDLDIMVDTDFRF